MLRMARKTRPIRLMPRGNIRYVDDILNYEGGAQLGAWQYGFFVYGGNFPWRSYDSATMELARKQDAADFVGGEILRLRGGLPEIRG